VCIDLRKKYLYFIRPKDDNIELIGYKMTQNKCESSILYRTSYLYMFPKNLDNHEPKSNVFSQPHDL